MNAIELLKKDHEKVADLFKQYESAPKDASSKKAELFRKIRRELEVHARIEEEIFYPAARQIPVEEARELVAEAREEHKEIKTLLAALSGMDAEDEQYDAKMKLLKEDVEHHVEEEQDELFPKVTKALGDERLEDIGRQLDYRKQSLMATGPQEDDDEEAEEARAAAVMSSPAVGGSRSTTRRSARGRSRDGSRPGSRSRRGSRSRSNSGSPPPRSSRGRFRSGSRGRSRAGATSRSAGSRRRSSRRH